LGEFLSQHYDVCLHPDMTAPNAIVPEPGDTLIGHPTFSPFGLFNRSYRHPGWRRVILIYPFAPEMRQAGFLNRMMPYCNQYLAITGGYWFKRIAETSFSHWLPRMAHVDLAVDRGDFPAVKTRFNPMGQRRFVYIGRKVWFKNLKYLSAIARRMPEIEFAWIGTSRLGGIEGVKPLGWQDMGTDDARRIVAEYDFLITVGNCDANPTTVLEAMAWGLIPVCTPQSGYQGYPSIRNIPLNDLEGAIQVIEELQRLWDEDLRRTQVENWDLLDRHFNWGRVGRQVVEAIESNVTAPLGRRPTLPDRIRMRTAHWFSLATWFMPWMLYWQMKHLWRNRHGRTE